MNLSEIVRGMPFEGVIVLATILGLHDPEKPKNVTSAHRHQAKGRNIVKTATSYLAGDIKPFLEQSIDDMKSEVISEIRLAGGHTVANAFRKGEGVDYDEIVRDVARHLNVKARGEIEVVEGRIAQKVLKDLFEKLSPEQREKLDAELEKVAEQYGATFTAEGGVLVGLMAAQLSGFGIYLAASTTIGAMTNILGLTLPFAFYTGMSKAVSIIIGPVGWTLLGLWTTIKAGSPRMKKLIPVVLFVAAERNKNANPNEALPKTSKVIVTVSVIATALFVAGVVAYFLHH